MYLRKIVIKIKLILMTKINLIILYILMIMIEWFIYPLDIYYKYKKDYRNLRLIK